MKILVTGAAGFIGMFLSKKLISLGHKVVGLDNINDYYSVDLKYNRLLQLGVNKTDIIEGKLIKSTVTSNFKFIKTDINNYNVLEELFVSEEFDTVVNLAAQAGVRYSIENPFSYIQSNVVGFLNILELCRHKNVNHLIYASSSSVYGHNKKIPFEETDNVDYPVSLYAATKKSNELIAHSYSHLYGIQTTGLRFFTVYGPWGRPDMAPMLFANALMNKKPINVFNNGEMERDFTYIDDIINGIVNCLNYQNINKPPNEVFNIGNSKPVNLLKFIEILENKIGNVSPKNMLPMQPGDVKRTYASVEKLKAKVGYDPQIDLEEGLSSFSTWYKEYYK
ncbi:NAD-dependent epimerase/dehydratase family protein [uncultured Maribacter sp.]|uniref:NAD-dependent epimerase/dehydratase family protein n=1 Tax=uncultured Maribacter sp. TaxID=431308 RepID=UPI0026234F32|nr:NAD-dependent epimerase/dehydratase family protein [uncultured Maribacter sp.]